MGYHLVYIYMYTYIVYIYMYTYIVYIYTYIVYIYIYIYCIYIYHRNLKYSPQTLVKLVINQRLRPSNDIISERRLAGIPHGAHQEGPLQGLQPDGFGLRNHPQLLRTRRVSGKKSWRFFFETFFEGFFQKKYGGSPE